MITFIYIFLLFFVFMMKFSHILLISPLKQLFIRQPMTSLKNHQARQEKKYIWVDCDPGVDDTSALLLTASNPFF